MHMINSWKKLLLLSAALVVLGAGLATAANKYAKPQSIIHVVTLYYKDGTTAEQKKTVLDGVERMAAEIPGIKNIWLRSFRVQGAFFEKQEDGTMRARPYTDAFVIEFENEAAFKAYDDHPAHRAWEKIYVPLRARSATSGITN